MALEANVKQYTDEMEKARRQTDGLGKKVDDLDAKLGRAREGIAVGVAAGAVATLGLATKAASDLNETTSKSATVFGEAQSAVMAYAEDAAQGIGLSKKEALDATSVFGNLFTQLGVGQGEAAKLSTSMVTLAADFGSFFNEDPTAIIEAQTAAFRGEFDALQKYVPTINAAAVEQRAMAETGKANASQLSQQEKALATYSLMVEGAGAAQGDFARTSDSAANAQKRAQAEIKNTTAEIGQAMLPLYAAGAEAVGTLARAYGELPGPVQTGTIAVIAAAAAWHRWGEAISDVSGSALGRWKTLSEGLEGVAATRGITKTQAATEALKASMSGAVGPGGRLEQTLGGISTGAGAAGFAMVALGAILYAWQDERDKDAKRAAELSAAIATIADEAVRTGATVESVFASQTLPQSLGVTSGLFQDVGIDVGELNDKLLAGGDEWNRYAQAQIAAAGGMDSAKGLALAAAFRDLQDELGGARVSTDAQRQALDELGLTIDPVTGETITLTQAVEGSTKAQGRAEAQARRTASAFDELGSSGAGAFRGLGEGINFAELAAEAYTTRALGVFDAQQAYDASTVELTAHQREAAEVQAQNAETARQNAEAIRRHAEDVRAAADDVASAREVQAEAASNLAAVEADAQAQVAAAWAETLPTAEAMVQAAERVTAAEEETARAAEAGRLAREGLNQALQDGARYLRDLAEAADDNNRSVSRADLAYREALAAQAALAADPTPTDDPFAAERAALRVADALDALQDAQERAADSAQARAEADRAGVDGTPQVLAAREAIARADESEARAAQSLADARQEQAETTWNAALHLAEVQEESAARVAEAQGQLSDAADDVNAAQAALNATQAEAVELSRAEAVEQTDLGAVIVANAKAKLGLAEAEAFANGRTLTAAESAAILRQGLEEGRRATGFWSTDLGTLAGALDNAARQRTVTLETQEAMDRARELGYKVETLPNGHIRVTADTSQANGALDGLGSRIGALGSQLGIQLGSALGVVVNGYAGGGRVRRGEVAWVGEEGPELVQFPADGYVHDAATSRRIGMGTVSMFGGRPAPAGQVAGTMAPNWAQPSSLNGGIDYEALGAAVAASLPHQGPLVNVEQVNEGVGLDAVFRQAEFAARAA